MFRFANIDTFKEKKQMALYYEKIRFQMEKMREEIEEIEENKFNNKLLKIVKKLNFKILLKDIKSRPDFLEPLIYRNFIIKNI